MTVLDSPLRAEVLLELFDADTGRKVADSGGENYISPAGLAFARWKTRDAYMNGMSTIGNQDTAPGDPFRQVYLSDSGATIDTGSDHPEGAVIGWADKTAYSGSDPYRGGPNVTECEADLDRAKWVFDWSTSAAIGTIKSVGWCYSIRAPGGTYLPSFSTDPDDTTPLNGSSMASTLMPSGLVYRGTTGTTQPKLIDPVTLANAGDFGPTPVQVNAGMVGIKGAAHDGVSMYVVGAAAAATIWKFPLPTGTGAVTATSITVPGATNLQGIAYDGTMLWVADKGTGKMFRVDKTTGAIDRQFSISTDGVCSVSFNPARNTLLLTDGVSSPVTLGSYFTEFDLDGNVVGRIVPPASAGVPTTYNIVPLGGTAYLFDYYNGSFTRLERNDVKVGSRILLPSPVTKSSLQTMKLTYTFTYS